MATSRLSMRERGDARKREQEYVSRSQTFRRGYLDPPGDFLRDGGGFHGAVQRVSHANNRQFSPRHFFGALIRHFIEAELVAEGLVPLLGHEQMDLDDVL